MSAMFDADSIIDAPASPTRPVYPGIGSPVPAKCPAGEDPAHRAEPEVRQRRGPVAASLLERTSEYRIYEGSLSLSYLNHTARITVNWGVRCGSVSICRIWNFRLDL